MHSGNVYKLGHGASPVHRALFFWAGAYLASLEYEQRSQSEANVFVI